MNQPSAAPVKRSRRGLIIVALILAVLIGLVIWHVLKGGKQTKRGNPAQVVTVMPATLGDMPQTLSALGTVTPYATVTVLPQLSGYLTEVPFKEGQDIQKGQLLAQIDPRQYQINKDQAEAQLAKDQASLDQARSDLARYAQLNEQKSIAEQTYTDQKFTVQQDEAAVKSDQAAIAQYVLDLEYCHITAPVSGRVGLRLVDVGNYVTASSSTGIAVITQMKPTSVQFAVPQNSLGDVIDNFNKSGNKLPVQIFSADNTKQIATGELYAIGNQMATGTGTVMLRADVPNNDESLYPNEFVNVKLLINTLHNAVLVPTSAIQTGAPGTFVYLVNGNNTVSVHKVTTGPSDGKNTVVLTGLSQGDQVATDGTDRLSDGAKIRAHASSTSGASSAAVADANAEISGDESAGGQTAAAASGASWAHGHHHHHPASDAQAAQAN